jgi:diguanylate cyclase (GGDEF)-like protein
MEGAAAAPSPVGGVTSLEAMANDIGDRTIVADRSLLDPGALQKGHASLVVMKGAEIGRDYRLKRARTILGRDPSADVQLPDRLVSREHACIEFLWDADERQAHYILIDQGSTNYTFVNSRQVRKVELMDGDKIQLGNTVLKFVLLDDIETKFHEEVRNRITYDQLTGLLTKESLYLALDKELQRCRRYHLPLAVLMMDLDRFKSVNDTHGHAAGSRVLTEVGRRIRESVRALDVSARYGGEEFVTYLAETDAAGGGVTAERVRDGIGSRPFEVDGASIVVTISIGVAAFPGHGDDPEALVKRADAALYRAKAGGRNRVCIEPPPRRAGRGRGAAAAAKAPAPARGRRAPKKAGRARSRGPCASRARRGGRGGR